MADADRVRAAGLPIGHHHPHLVCRNCGTVADADWVPGHVPCLDPVAATGFEVEDAEVTFWGLCPACQGRARA
jgi:Fur family transcriptional regulator, stress-responsive regulator